MNNRTYSTSLNNLKNTRFNFGEEEEAVQLGPSNARITAKPTTPKNPYHEAIKNYNTEQQKYSQYQNSQHKTSNGQQNNQQSPNNQQSQQNKTQNGQQIEQMPRAPRIAPEFVDIHEVMKDRVAKQYKDDDAYIGVQSTVGGTIAGAALGATGSGSGRRNKAFKEWYIVFDTRNAITSDPANGQYTFDIGQYMQQVQTNEYNLNGVVQMTISPFTIPAVVRDEFYAFASIGLRISEVNSSVITSARTEAPTHFQFSFADVGLGRLLLTPTLPPNGIFIIQQPVLLNTATFTFTLPLNYNSTVTFPPLTFIATYLGVTPTTTVFSNLLGVNLVVGDVLFFTSSDPVLVANNPTFFNQQGHFIETVLPLQFEITGVYNLVGGIPGVTQVTVAQASNVIRIPMKFKVVYDGEGNFINSVSQ